MPDVGGVRILHADALVQSAPALTPLRCKCACVGVLYALRAFRAGGCAGDGLHSCRRACLRPRTRPRRPSSRPRLPRKRRPPIPSRCRSSQTVGVTYSKGYRAGFQEITLGGVLNTVNPEYLDAYEVSYRSNWLDETLWFNSYVFYYDYADQQVAVDDPNFPGVAVIVNGGSSHAYGAEFETRWRPIAPLQLFGSVGLLKTKFDEYSTNQGNFSGKEFPESPAYTVAAGGMYKARSGWFAGTNVRYTDGYYSAGDLANTALRFVDGYTIVDVRTGWEWEHYTLTVFAKNVLDKEYLTSISQGATEATVGDERLVGVTVRGRF
jgi:iron complex outermembrane receptor protein